MLLSKRIWLLLATFILLGCADQDNGLPIGNRYLVKFRSAPGVEQFKNLENYIFNQNRGELKSIVVMYNNSNKKEADYIDDMMYSRYGFRTVKKFMNSKSEHISVMLEYGKVTVESCYRYALSDFNWYNSSASKINEYSNAIICDPVDNDLSARM